MAEETTTFLQHPIFSEYLLPFLLVFFIVFAILEKTKLFGEGKKQLNALTSFIIGLIFVGAVVPKLVVGKMILFLAVTMVIIFVILLLWGFIFGDKEGFKLEKWMKWALGIIVGIAFIWAILWATGWNATVGSVLAGQNRIWTNVAFVVVIAIALALVLIGKKESK